MNKHTRATRDGFGQGLLEAAQKNPAVVGLCADLTESTKMDAFATAFPDRFIELGVAEQNLAGVAAGCALAGKIPVAASYACFHPANSWGVIRTSIAYSNLNVKLVGGHAGLVTGPDGATHQSLEDLALMTALPNMTVISPADFEEAKKATQAMIAHQGPVYLRTSKFGVDDITTEQTPFQIGKAMLLRAGKDITLIANGVMVGQALQLANSLELAGHSTRVLNMHTLKPLDTTAIITAAHETKAIFTLEDHQIFGGLGSGVATVLAEDMNTFLKPIVFKRFGVNDRFGESGKPEELLKAHGLLALQLLEVINTLL